MRFVAAIGMLAIFLFGCASAPPRVDADEVRDYMRDYVECVRKEAAKYLANEQASASEVADAAISKCQVKYSLYRQKVIEGFIGVSAPNNRSAAFNEGAEFAERTKRNLRQSIIQYVLDER